MTGIPQSSGRAGDDPAAGGPVEQAGPVGSAERGGSMGRAALAELVERAVRSTGAVVELYPPGGIAPRAAAAGLERLGLPDAVPRVAIDRGPDRTRVEVALGVRSSVPSPLAVRRVREAIAIALGAVTDAEVVVRATVVHVLD